MSAPAHAWVLAGATATGKSAAAQLLAEQLGCAVLSADAMLVYRGMDIGTAKPTAAERGAVPYFGLDLATPAEAFSAGLWLADARRALRAAATSSARAAADAGPPSAAAREAAEPVPGCRLNVAGGTGLYIKALTEGLDSSGSEPARRAHWQALFEREGLAALQRAVEALAPGALADVADPANPRRLIRALEHLEACGRLPQSWKTAAAPAAITALRLPREQLHARIERRVRAMFRQGLPDEVRRLREIYPVWSATAAQAIGYAEVCALLDGTLPMRDTLEKIATRTRQLAKRQETWFRHQAAVHWIDIEDDDPAERVAERVLASWRHHGPTHLQLT